MTTPLQEFLNEQDVMAFEDIEPITVKVGHIDDFTMDIGDLRDAASNEAKIAALTKALEVLLEEAENFSVSGVYFNEECMGHKGPALARAALSSHTEQEGGGRG